MASVAWQAWRRRPSLCRDCSCWSAACHSPDADQSVHTAVVQCHPFSHHHTGVTSFRASCVVPFPTADGTHKRFLLSTYKLQLVLCTGVVSALQTARTCVSFSAMALRAARAGVNPQQQMGAPLVPPTIYTHLPNPRRLRQQAAACDSAAPAASTPAMQLQVSGHRLHLSSLRTVSNS